VNVRPPWFWLLSFFSVLAISTLVAGCDDPKPRPGPMGSENDYTSWETERTTPTSPPRVDMIFVIDNSSYMANQQTCFQGSLRSLFDTLLRFPGGLPDLHLGVITPDLGSSPYDVPGCERPGGDGGRFLKGVDNGCVFPENQTYIVDVAPRGCSVERQDDPGSATSCWSHDCVQAHCDEAAFTGLDGVATEPAGLTLYIDENGCPRCRNTGEPGSLEALMCSSSSGAWGCGFEQPLEALQLALSDRSGDNAGFLRSDAYLAVVFFTNEDDCSVKWAEFFDPTGDIDSELGALTSFRCTEFGVTCDEPWDRHNEGHYTHCRPRETDDGSDLLGTVSGYVRFISELMDPERILPAAIAGPSDGTLNVALDGSGNPRLQQSCGNWEDAADPAVRLQAFVQAFHDWPIQEQWPFFSLCSPDYGPALTGLALELFSRAARVQEHRQCAPQALYGCPDPSFAAGGPKTSTVPDPIAAVCAPDCEVTIPGESSVPVPVPPCDPAWAGGHPEPVDPDLPVEICYHIVHDPLCLAASERSLAVATGNAVPTGAQVVFSRRELDPFFTPGVNFRCRALPPGELTCDDGFDNDQDGQPDGADPDCP